MSKTREEIMDFYYNGILDATTPLIAFKVGGDAFCGDFEENGEIVDFEELTVVTERKWLFDYMKKDGIGNPEAYLEEEYTTEDSKYWFDDGVIQHKIIAISF